MRRLDGSSIKDLCTRTVSAGVPDHISGPTNF